MEIPPVPADLSQIIKARSGQMVPVENDVQNVANDLAAIDPHFCLRYSEAGEYFVVYYRPDGADRGDGYVVTTAQELDQRIVKRVEQVHNRVVNDPTYNVSDEAQKLAEEKREHDEYDRREKMGEKHERLQHAMQKDLGYAKNRIWVPGDDAA